MSHGPKLPNGSSFSVRVGARNCCADPRKSTLVLEVVIFFSRKPHTRRHPPPPLSPTPGFVYTEPPGADYQAGVLLSCRPPCPRSGGAAVSGRAWYLWGLLFSPCGDHEDSEKKLLQLQTGSLADCKTGSNYFWCLGYSLAPTSVQSSRFGLMGVPSWAA